LVGAGSRPGRFRPAQSVYRIAPRIPSIPFPPLRGGRGRRHPLGADRGLLLAALLLLAAGCSGFHKGVPSGGRNGAQGAQGGEQGAAPPGPPPWEVPASAYGSQTLYRVGVAGAEGEGSLRLTLRLAAPDRYQVQAVDPLGRALWGLDVEGDHGLWLDHRARVYCRLAGALDLAFLPLGPLSLSALPPLLLGRLPVAPADAASVTRRPSAAGSGLAEVAYDDAAGRHWSAVVREGQPLSWGLWQDPAAGPILSWLSSGGWAVLSDRRKGVQVRWRQALREELRQLAPLAAPAEYGQGRCAKAPP
jgi:hypothetical protein